jgi:hypothetical protein
MQHDELIWELINHGHCSFRSRCVVVVLLSLPGVLTPQIVSHLQTCKGERFLPKSAQYHRVV